MNPSKAIVTIDQNHAFTTSLLVAEKFNKQHKDVLKALRNLDCSEEFSRRNFAPRKHQYTTGKNQIRDAEMYQITRDGFSFLAMGFTGQEAAQWKERFINAFNQMEQLLNKALVTEHHAMQESLFDRHPQWRETVEATQNGMATGELAKRQGKSKSAARAMKARIRAAGLDCRPLLLTQPATLIA